MVELDVVYADGWKIWRDEQGRNYACPCANPARDNKEAEKRAQLPRISDGAQICALANRYASGFTRKHCWLMFQGAPGSGKTVQAVLIARAVMQRGFKARYVHLPSFARDLVALRDKPRLRQELLDTIKPFSLVILDDVLKNLPALRSFEYQHMQTAISDVFFTLANASIPTVLTTAPHFADFNRFDASLANTIRDRTKGFKAVYESNDWQLVKL